MLAIEGVFDGSKVDFLKPVPKKHAKKKATVSITFLDDEKVPASTKRAVLEMTQGRLLNLDEVLRAD